MFRTTNLHKVAIVLALALMLVLVGMVARSAVAAVDPVHVSFTLEGCRNDGTIILPDSNGDFICPDAAYTTGNLGKGWNELDLVPHRLTTSLGNQTAATTEYTVAVTADHEEALAPGYDVLSALVVNVAKSDASCQVVNGPQSVLDPGIGGTDKSLYRLVTISQAKGTECVFDYYERLALGSHLFPGSSLHSNLMNQNFGTQGIGAKDVSIPVKEILPQELRKDMTATQDAEHTWNLTKAPTPANLIFGNTCVVDPAARQQTVQIRVEWTKIAATPTGDIDIITNIYAKNPASRIISVEVVDKIYSGLDLLDEESSGLIDVPANTEMLVLTHQTTAPAGSTDLHDVATATYTDKVTGVAVPGQTQAEASALVQPSGTTLNQTAIIDDSESISGLYLTFSTDAFSGASGSFLNGYIAGTETVGPVDWQSDSQGDSGYVEFAKTVYVAQPAITSGTLSDLATLNGSDGFNTTATADVGISTNAFVSLTINKTIPDLLQAGEGATFSFDVYYDPAGVNASVGTYNIDFGPGETFGSTTINGLEPGTYNVVENAPAGWQAQSPQQVSIDLPECAGSVSFANEIVPASARVRKITVPAGFEAGWTFTLDGPTGQEQVVTTGAGYIDFQTELGEGDYTITETPQPGWLNTNSQGCTFNVDYPDDAGAVFSCEFENTYQPTVNLQKTGDELGKVTDPADFTLTPSNTSPTPGAAGAPTLACTLSDPLLNFSEEDILLAPGDSTVRNISYTFQEGDPDPFVNTATLSCTYQGLADVVATADASHTVELFQPAIDLTKEGDELSKIGDPVDYVITLYNNSSPDTPDLECTITDTPLGVSEPVTLASGASHVVNVNGFIIPEGASDPYSNTATVLCSPIGFDNEYDDSATWETNLFQPAIDLTKEGDELSKIGDPVDYVITLYNNSSPDTPDLECTITDTPLGVSEPVTLASGASHVVNVNGFIIPEGASDPYSNTATVLCSPIGFDNEYDDSATWETNLFQPSIDVVKTGPDFSKVGDTVTYNVYIENTSSADTPNLSLASFSDSLAGNVTLPEACDDLPANGASCSFTYDYVVQAGDDSGEVGAQLENTATAVYNPDGFPNPITDNDGSNTWSLTLLHPSFEVTKDCKVDTEPIPQEGPAIFTIVYKNTGDADLIFTPNEGAPVVLEAGQETSVEVELAGPFTGQATVENTVSGVVTLDPRYQLDNSYEFSASGDCRVGSRVNVYKTSNNVVDPTKDWQFAIFAGPNFGSGSGFLGSPLATATTLNDADGILTFGDINLDPLAAYTVCEMGSVASAGWTSEWEFNGVVINPYNPHLTDPEPQNLGVHCIDFGADTAFPLTAGGLLTFDVNNSRPGGEPRTPGYWKNWSSCTSGGQYDKATGENDPNNEFWALDELLSDPGFLVGTLTLGDGDCIPAVRVLDHRDIETDRKMANDAAYDLARNLFAYYLNQAAGACQSTTADDAALSGQALLVSIDWNGTGKYLRPKDAEYADALAYSKILDDYNNGLYCTQ